MSITLAKIGEIGGQIQQLAPLAIQGIVGAKDMIMNLIDAIKDWNEEGDQVSSEQEQAGRAEGARQLAKLQARAEEAKVFLERQNQT